MGTARNERVLTVALESLRYMSGIALTAWGWKLYEILVFDTLPLVSDR